MKYWNDHDFINTIKNCTTITQVLRKFNKPTNQGHYNRKFHFDVERLNIDISHFRLPKTKSKIPINIICVKNSLWKGRSSDLKKRLIKDNLINNVCYLCGQLSFWNGKHLTLQLDHINGINDDNRIENLRILCPNCHSQTDTFSGKHKKTKQKPKCQTCNKQHPSKSKLCLECSLKERVRKTKINWPSNDELINLLKESNYSQLGKKLGVSDNAIRRRLQKND